MKKIYQFTAVVNYNGQSYLVDSCDTFDAGYEMMVFKLRKKFPNAVEKQYNCESGQLINLVGDDCDWSDLICRHYPSVEEAEKDFDEVVADFSTVYKEIEDDCSTVDKDITDEQFEVLMEKMKTIDELLKEIHKEIQLLKSL